ncbi:hypothetical protein ILYODFUR_004457 [Ilyodon furcidens]|uniref:Uncharacterized protein n=1 Tax=Ilyodon furcidens TaxID=33524 RepID=A0ABV0SJB5_9TELE
MSRKRTAESVSEPSNTPERKRPCWGILISQGSWADRSPLHDAASQGRLLVLRRLLAEVGPSHTGYLANTNTINHVTPLHEACLSGHVACVRALLSVGANVNAATIDGVTPLYNCCASGSIGCMELLLQNGAHMHTRHAHFPSPLHEACRRGKHTHQEPCMNYSSFLIDQYNQLYSHFKHILWNDLDYGVFSRHLRLEYYKANTKPI